MLVIENAYYCEKAAELLGARFMGSGEYTFSLPFLFLKAYVVSAFQFQAVALLNRNPLPQ